MQRFRHILTATLLAIAATTFPSLPLAESAGAASTTDPALRSTYIETLEVNLVVLHVAVLDKRGEAVTGLSPKDFKVTEDGLARAISVFGSSMDQPVRIAFLLDVSGSMALLDRLERAKSTIRRFADSLMPHDEIALLIFADGDVTVKLPFTSDRASLRSVLDPIQPYGKTALKNALAKAPELLAATSPGRKALVILTDGADNASTLTTLEAIYSAREAAVPIFAIGMCDLPLDLKTEVRPPSGGRTLFEILEEFSHGTGGEFFPVFDSAEIDAAVQRMEEQIRGQYIIGYDPGPTSTNPGFHRIEVRTHNAKHQVLSRPGYVTVR